MGETGQVNRLKVWRIKGEEVVSLGIVIGDSPEEYNSKFLDGNNRQINTASLVEFLMARL
jgi:hypothetical protein